MARGSVGEPGKSRRDFSELACNRAASGGAGSAQDVILARLFRAALANPVHL
jgi:hypothetical protein